MPAKKKRATFTKPDAADHTAASTTPPPQTVSRPLPTIDETRPSPQLEEMLEAEAGESVLKKKNTILYSAGIIGAVIVVGASIFLYAVYLSGQRLEKGNNAAEKTPVFSITTTPSPSPVPMIVEVFNGSGVPGAAAKAADWLRAKGYQISGTGNAVRTARSVLLVASGVSDAQLTRLAADSLELFGIASSSGILSDSSSSARIIIGAK